jgi:glycosyltransferase involved in cell wall biosynthesis
MRVALDTGSLYVTQAGTSRYVRGLMRGFAELNDPEMELRPLAWPVSNFDYTQPRRMLKTIYRELIWSPFVAPRQMLAQGANLLHRTTTALPIRRPPGVREVVTLHDIAVLRFPERYRRWQRISQPLRLKRLHSSDRIICVSRFAADEGITLLGLKPDKIDVVYHGNDFDPAADIVSSTPPTDFQPPDSFFLFVGSIEPGKNLVLLKSAYQMAETAGITLPPLLIVGARWQGVGREGIPPQGFRFLGHRPDSELAWLYSRAVALLFPSKYEGFGLPVIEAMGNGCPVVCSPVASLPEVGGEAAMYVDMTPSAYLSAMQRLEGSEAERMGCIERGRQNVTRFSWRKCAEQTIQVYRKALE